MSLIYFFLIVWMYIFSVLVEYSCIIKINNFHLFLYIDYCGYGTPLQIFLTQVRWNVSIFFSHSPLHQISCKIGICHLSVNTMHTDLLLYANFLPTSLVAQTVKRLPTMRETWVQFLGREDLLEKAMAPHSSILAWKIPWMVEPGRLQSMGLQRVGQDWATSLSFFHFLLRSLHHYELYK